MKTFEQLYVTGQTVHLVGVVAPIVITYEHSGNYDSQYTGSDPEGNTYYFNDRDVISENI